MNCEEAIRAFPLPRQKAYVGFSGGSDSTALLLLLHQAGWAVEAVHFNHCLRGAEAEAEVQWCRDFCAGRNIPYRNVTFQVRKLRRPGESIEEAARRLRLCHWRELAAQEWRPVFLAHHADDALEELFLRLGRGANLSGALGLRPLRRMAGGLLLCRPLLECRKAELAEYLRQQRVVQWCEDATNAVCDCRRNAVRNRLLPLMREIFGSESGLCRALAVLREDADYIEEQAAALKPETLQQWRAVPPALLPRVVRRIFDLPLPPTGQTVQRLRRALSAPEAPGGRGRLIPLDERHWFRIHGGGLSLESVKDGTEEGGYAVVWRWREEPQLFLPDGHLLRAECRSADEAPHSRTADCCCEEFEVSSVPPELLVRSWRCGDRMQPFGGNGHSSLKKLFNHAKIFGDERLHVPVICAGGTVIWVPGVRRAEFGRLASDSNVLRISFR